jgi:Bacterial EndoU nuclease
MSMGVVNYCALRAEACMTAVEATMGIATDSAAPSALPTASVRQATTRVATTTDTVADEAAALRRIGQNNSTVAARNDNAVISSGDQALATDLADRARIRPDTSRDTFYAANTDQTVLKNNNFDMAHVLSGEINPGGRATGYHAEFAADGQARITPGATLTQNANGTYEAPVQIWNDVTKQWVDKVTFSGGIGRSTFFPPSWSEARVTYEVTEAFKNGLPGTSFQATTPSGIRIQFYWDATNQRITFFPLK